MNINIFPPLKRVKHSVALWATMLVTATANITSAQTVVVLPGASNYSNSSSPQGGVRFQRGFYLITPSEMNASSLPNNSVINSIGFTIGAAQNIKTKGGFKVYLQNTTDVVSRIDNNWKTFTVTTNAYNADELFPGNYEWQVSANCGTASAFSSVMNFSNERLPLCIAPSKFSTTGITDVSATFNWIAPAAGATKYFVEYRVQGGLTWTGDTVTTLSYTATGLQPDKPYQWRVKSVCTGTSSLFETNNFTTNNTNACNPPTALTTSGITNTAATFSWTAASGANYYNLQYRRKGTTPWLSSLAFSTTSSITALVSGTTYEWQVQSVCNAGKGAYTKGLDVTTPGTTQCYPPNDLSTDKLAASSTTFSWTATAGATSYTVRFRLKDAISWKNAIDPMINVHNDSITVPETIGSYSVPFKSGSTFSYTGNGVYVGWEYINDSVLSSPNTTISTIANSSLKGIYGQDSIIYNLSFSSRLDTNQLAADTILLTTNVRPETIFGTPSVKDYVDVAAVYALGNTSDLYSNPTPISALVRYLGTVDTTLDVRLTVKDQATGTIRFTSTVNTAFTAKSNKVVAFTGWSPTRFETDSLIVSVTARIDEEILNNNKNYYLQKVNRSIISYDDGSPALTSAGLDTLAGLSLIKQKINGCGSVNAAQVFLTPSAKDKAVYAVVLNAAKTIVATSASFTPDSSQVNSYHSFYFPTPPALSNEVFYIGLAQQKGIKGLRPVGVQWENGYPRTDAYFIDSINGGKLKEFPAFGRLMIKAEIITAGLVPVITGNPGLCNGTTTLTATARSTRFANSVTEFSSQNSNVLFSAIQALGTPNVFPAYATSPNAWISNSPDGQREFLVLGFSNPAPINYIDIFETLNPGAVDAVLVKNPTSGLFVSVYSAPLTATPAEARINRINFPLTTFDVSEIRIELNSAAVNGYNAIDAVAIGEIKANPSFTSYNWMPGNLTTQSITVTTPGTYNLTVPTSAGCSSSDIIKTVIPGTITPTITASKTSFCQGDSIFLKSSQVGGNTWSTGSTKDSIFIKTAGPFTVSYNDGSGCGITTSAPYNATINPLPVVAITGILGICPGGSTTLDAGVYTSYRWNTGATTRTITATAAGTYTVTVVNSNGCRGTGSATTTMSTRPVPVIIGILSFCPGKSTTVSTGDFSSYAWTGGSTTATNTVTTTGPVTVTVTNAAGCSGSATATISLFELPRPTISGATGICPAGSTILTANAGYVNYQWSGSSSATTPSISANTVGNYAVTVTDNNGCMGISAEKTLGQFNNPIPVISGTLSFCGGNSTVLDAGFGYASYQWTTGETSRSIAVTTVGTYSVTVADNNTCKGTANATTTSDNAIPVTPGPISGTASGLCSGTYQYSIQPVNNASNYDWTVPSGVTILSGQGTTNITVLISNTFTSGNLIVAASNACGQSPSLNPRSLFLQALPVMPGPISGPSSGVCGQTNKSYSITEVAGAGSYTWTVPTGATITSGQNTSSIVVSFASNFTSGNICVKSNSGCGSSASSCLAVAGTPVTPGTISGILSVCLKQKNVTYSVQPVAGATSYTWTVPSQATVTSGQGTNSIIVTFGTKAGNVTVKANGTCGSSAIRSLAVDVKCTGAVSSLASFTPIEQNVEPAKRIVAYPNPSNGMVSLRFPSEFQFQQYEIRVLDAQGKNVYAENLKLLSNAIILNLTKLSKGIYFINIVNGQKNEVVKIIIQ